MDPTKRGYQKPIKPAPSLIPPDAGDPEWWDPCGFGVPCFASPEMGRTTLPRCSMVLEYLPTKLDHFWGKCKDSYSSTMEHLGYQRSGSRKTRNHRSLRQLPVTWSVIVALLDKC